MATRILWLEGSRTVNPSFVPGLRAKGYQVECVPTCKAALACLDSFFPNLAVVNAASFRGNGKRTCHTLRERLNGHPLFLICEQAQRPVATDANVLVLPFTIRKLLNQIQALAPIRTGELLRRGPLTLYPDCHLVQVNGGDLQRLTPNLTALLRALMLRPGTLWVREELFREVWETDYVGDTRTLDTHISWLRRKIEPDSKNPVLLKTVRGLGYRLDL